MTEDEKLANAVYDTREAFLAAIVAAREVGLTVMLDGSAYSDPSSVDVSRFTKFKDPNNAEG